MLKLILLIIIAVFLCVLIVSLYRTFIHFLKKHDIRIFHVLTILINQRSSHKKRSRSAITSLSPINTGKDILLITACIDAGTTPYVTLRDPIKRLEQYIDAATQWVTKSDIENIVFCDNSNFQFDKSRLLDLAQEHGKTIEIISFKGNKLSAVKGKGYGEGEIIAHAVNNSRLFSRNDTFFKITGRLFVNNFNSIRKAHSRMPNVFNKLSIELGEEQAETRFYKSSVSFYSDHLMDAYMEIDDTKGRYMEHVMYSRLKKTGVPSFRIFPDFVGVSATSGKDHKLTSIDVRWKSFLSKLGLYDI